jgi:aryl-alcohol dehydrogenase-like predicted oxidoreductase
MNKIALGNTGLHATPVGFGCASILGRNSRSESLRALSTAWDEGVRFFDTARSYGYGESEAVLGSFLKGKRDEAVVATKFGILPSKQSGWKRLARAGARSVLKLAPGTHKLLQRGAATQLTQNQFSVEVLQQSIHESLGKLGTDYVDMLFLHAAPASVLEQEDLLEAMSRLVEAGKVRVAGLSAEPPVVAQALRGDYPELQAMQFPCNVFDVFGASGFGGSGNGGRALVANHPFGGAARVQQTREVISQLSKDESLASELREKLTGGQDGLLADVVLNTILRNSGIHVVIPAMMKSEHIRMNIRAVRESRFSDGEIVAIRAVLAASIL